jgi:hypothetical protein
MDDITWMAVHSWQYMNGSTWRQHVYRRYPLSPSSKEFEAPLRSDRRRPSPRESCRASQYPSLTFAESRIWSGQPPPGVPKETPRASAHTRKRSPVKLDVQAMPVVFHALLHSIRAGAKCRIEAMQLELLTTRHLKG